MRNVLIVVILIVVGAPCYGANNPADLTCNYRVCPIDYFKAVHDGGPWSALAIKAIREDASLLVWNWHSEDESCRLWEGSLSFKLSDSLQAGLIRDEWAGASDKTSAVFDFHSQDCKVGLGAIISRGEIVLGPRASFGKSSFYATVSEAKKPLFGAGYYSSFNFDLTIGHDIWYFRTSKVFGRVIPELRLRGEGDEFFVGMGLGLCL